MGAASAPELAKDGTGRVVPAGGIAYWLSEALAVAAALSALLTYLVSGMLRGPAVMNGSARGTALVVLVVGVPVLACSLVLARRGSAIAVVTWLAAIGFLLYNALMFVFATPVNRLFLLYLAMLSLAAWSAGTLLWHTDVHALGRLIPARAPVRLAAGYLWTLVILNGGAWLVRILPTLANSGEPAYLRGTGMTTNIVFVQDLALWVPLMAVAAAWLWQRKPRGYLLGGASIVLGATESISIAADQWYGHAADAEPQGGIVRHPRQLIDDHAGRHQGTARGAVVVTAQQQVRPVRPTGPGHDDRHDRLGWAAGPVGLAYTREGLRYRPWRRFLADECMKLGLIATDRPGARPAGRDIAPFTKQRRSRTSAPFVTRA